MTKPSKREIAQRLEDLETDRQRDDLSVSITHIAVDSDGEPVGITRQSSGTVNDGLEEVPPDEIEPEMKVWIRDAEGNEYRVSEDVASDLVDEEDGVELIDNREPIVLEPLDEPMDAIDDTEEARDE